MTTIDKIFSIVAVMSLLLHGGVLALHVSTVGLGPVMDNLVVYLCATVAYGAALILFYLVAKLLDQ